MGVKLKIISCKSPLRGAELILLRYQPIDVVIAQYICKKLKCDEELVLWTKQRKTISDVLSYYSVLDDIKDIHIRFYGGPTGYGSWHTGSIWAFILDHVANLILVQGYEKAQELLTC